MTKPASHTNTWWHLPAALLLFLFIISTAVVLALNLRAVYYHDINALHISENTGMSEEEIRLNYDVLIDYNLLWHREPLRFPSFPMSEGGQIHFREVKSIFDAFQILFLVSLGLFLILRLWARSLRSGLYARIAGYGCLGIVGALGLFALLGWEKLFVVFHQVFFRNDFWIFDAASDPVITILPEQFFLHEALLILGAVLLGGGLALFFGYRAKEKSRKAFEKDQS